MKKKEYVKFYRSNRTMITTIGGALLGNGIIKFLLENDINPTIGGVLLGGLIGYLISYKMKD